jgi:hypothetical protein
MLRGKISKSTNIVGKNFIKTLIHTNIKVMWMQKTLFDFMEDDVDIAKIKQK